jgi:hypothetical protein
MKHRLGKLFNLGVGAFKLLDSPDSFDEHLETRSMLERPSRQP